MADFKMGAEVAIGTVVSVRIAGNSDDLGSTKGKSLSFTVVAYDSPSEVALLVTETGEALLVTNTDQHFRRCLQEQGDDGEGVFEHDDNKGKGGVLITVAGGIGGCSSSQHSDSEHDAWWTVSTSEVYIVGHGGDEIVLAPRWILGASYHDQDYPVSTRFASARHEVCTLAASFFASASAALAEQRLQGEAEEVLVRFTESS